MATLFRVRALRSIPKYREKVLGIDSGIYLKDNLVEDYEITLCLKHSWQVMACMDMLAWTDVPLRLRELVIGDKIVISDSDNSFDYVGL